IPARSADEREQRRGLVLGLTLAEILLLLLFLLLLVLGSQIRTWRDRYEQLDQSLEEIRPLQQALVDGGAVDINGVDELVACMQNLQQTEQELSKLKTENADLAKQSELLKSLGLGSDDTGLNLYQRQRA